MKEYSRFLWRCFRLSLGGDWRYLAWMTFLTVIAAVGLNAWAKQLAGGLITTGMTDHVSWGLYVANFTFLVGMAAAAVMLVIPVHVYRQRELSDLVIFGHLMAVAAILMALAFIVADLGRPDRFQEMLIRFNFPESMLTWDVLALNGYLLLNLHLPAYLIYCAYRQRKPSRIFHAPFVFLAIAWAIGVLTIEAYLFVGLGSRPFWNAAILAPRFIASAFAAGLAFMILALAIIDRVTAYEVPAKAFVLLRRIVTVALILGLLMLGSEIFTELYSNSAHSVSTKYLLFGMQGYDALVPWIRTAIVLQLLALLCLATPLARSKPILAFACLLVLVGLWIEKSMGLIVPAFIPSPLGEIVEYVPTWNESLVCAGIWAFGLLVFTVLVRITLPVLSGRLTSARDRDPLLPANQQPDRPAAPSSRAVEG